MIVYPGLTNNDLSLEDLRSRLLPDIEESLLEPENALLFNWFFVQTVWQHISSMDVFSLGGFGKLGEFFVRSLRFDTRFDSVPLFTIDFLKNKIYGTLTDRFILFSYRSYPDILSYMKDMVINIRPSAKCAGFITITDEGVNYGKPIERVIPIFSGGKHT